MLRALEESKHSTSSEEPEYDSDVDSTKVVGSDSGAPRVKISQYLSTQLIATKGLTLADIEVEAYPSSKIEAM